MSDVFPMVAFSSLFDVSVCSKIEWNCFGAMSFVG